MPPAQASSAGTPADQKTTPKAGTPPAGGETPTQLKKLHQLLSDAPAPEGDDDDEGNDPPKGGNGKAGAGAQKKAKPTKFNDLAEIAGVELDSLYKLELSLSEGGSPITIEQLKDAYTKREEQTVRELKWEEDRAKKEANLVRAQGELQELLAALPKDAIKPEVLQAAATKHQAAVKRERERALEVIPDWRDKAKREEDIAGMTEYLKGYGFPPNYLETVFDHRAVRFIRDAWQREQRIRKAFEQLESVKSTPAATKPKANGAAPKPGKGSAPNVSTRLVQLLSDD